MVSIWACAKRIVNQKRGIVGDKHATKALEEPRYQAFDTRSAKGNFQKGGRSSSQLSELGFFNWWRKDNPKQGPTVLSVLGG